MKETNIRYFAVVYSPDGTIHLWPGESKEACLNKLRSMRDSPRVHDRMEATTVIKRDMSNFKDGMIFGCPKSLDMIRSK